MGSIGLVDGGLALSGHWVVLFSGSFPEHYMGGRFTCCRTG